MVTDFVFAQAYIFFCGLLYLFIFLLLFVEFSSASISTVPTSTAIHETLTTSDVEIPTFIPGVPPKISTDDHTAVVDFRHFLSSDHDTLNRICNTLPPVQALSALEATLTERQLQGSILRAVN